LQFSDKFVHHILDVRKHLYQAGEADRVDASAGSELLHELLWLRLTKMQTIKSMPPKFSPACFRTFVISILASSLFS